MEAKRQHRRRGSSGAKRPEWWRWNNPAAKSAAGTTSKSTHLNNGLSGVGRGPLSLLRPLALGVLQDVPVQLLAVLPLAVPVPLRAPLLRAKPQQSLLTREPKRQNR